MCGSVKFEGRVGGIGQLVRIEPPATSATSAVWNGFATLENLPWWAKKAGFTYCHIRADVIMEGKITLRVPSARLCAIKLKGDVYHKGKKVGVRGAVKLLTRPSMGSFEEEIKGRMPVVRDPHSGQMHYWTVQDVIPPPPEQLELL